jgi:hypothetical protein
MDKIDIDQLMATVNSPGYAFIRKRQQDIFASKIRELRNGDNVERLRGFLDGVERCMEIPEVLRKEAEGR